MKYIRRPVLYLTLLLLYVFFFTKLTLDKDYLLLSVMVFLIIWGTTSFISSLISRFKYGRDNASSFLDILFGCLGVDFLEIVVAPFTMLSILVGHHKIEDSSTLYNIMDFVEVLADAVLSICLIISIIILTIFYRNF